MISKTFSVMRRQSFHDHGKPGADTRNRPAPGFGLELIAGPGFGLELIAGPGFGLELIAGPGFGLEVVLQADGQTGVGTDLADGEQYPGHEGHPVEGVVPDRQLLPRAAEQHLLVRRQATQAH